MTAPSFQTPTLGKRRKMVFSHPKFCDAAPDHIRSQINTGNTDNTDTPIV